MEPSSGLRKSAFVAAAALSAASLFAQDARFVGISRDDGLSSSAVSSIVQDSRGFLWFGTKNGLDRYDGYDFTVYSNDPFDSGSLSHNLVQTLSIDPDDVLWVGTYRGLNRFDTRAKRIVRYVHDPADPASLSNDVVTAVRRDRSGRLWVGTLDGLNLLDEDRGSFRRYRDAPDGGALPNDTVRAILETRDGVLWAGTYGGLLRYDREADAFAAVPGLPSNYVMALSEDEEGALWAACWGGGLSRLDPDRKTIRSWSFPDNRVYALLAAFPGTVYAGTWGGGLVELDAAAGSFVVHRADPRRPYALNHDVVYSLFKDDAGLLWVGTNGGGVHKLDRSRDRFQLFAHDPEVPGSLAKGSVQAVFEDSRGRLWVGTYSGGLDRRDPGASSFVHFRRDPANPRSLSNDIVNGIAEDAEGNIWVATNEGLNRFSDARGDFDRFEGPDPTFYSISTDSSGRLWFGYFREGAERVDRKTGDRLRLRADAADHGGLSDNMVYFIREDSRGSIWFGTNGGLNRLDGEGRPLVRFRHSSDDRNGLPGDTIRCMLEDSRGRLWFGSSPGGLSRFDPGTGRFVNLTRKDGLPASGVVSILEDDRGRLWLGTDYGLCVYDPESSDLRLLDARDGLQGAEFTSGHWKGADGSLYFGGLEGLNRIADASVRRNEYLPPVRLTSFKVFDRELLLNGGEEALREAADLREVRLSHRENFISIEFAALDYADPEANRYAYKLEGFDKDWVFAGNRRYASYTNLRGGRYVFRVKASNNHGVWNEEGLSLPISVTPSFWTTPAAFVLYFAAGAFFAVFLVAWFSREQRLRLSVAELDERRRIDAELKEAKERAEAADRAKSEFLANLSHEIRTPMNAVLGYAGILAEKMSADPRRSLVEVIDRSGRSLLALLNDALDISRLDAGKARVKSAPLRPRSLLSDLESLFLLRAEEKGIEIRVSVDEAVPQLILGDEPKLRQILVNLMGNAVKFTDRGSVEVSATASADPLRIIVAVSDSGPGLSEEAKRRVFEPFYQQEQMAERYGGTGLGLSIAYRLAAELGGGIGVESVPGEGSRFTLTVPAALPPDDAAAALPTDAAGRDARRLDGVRLLVVGDDPVGADILGRLLSARGASVRTVEGPAEGLRALDGERPEAVLADLRLSGSGGFSFLDEIRGRTDGKSLPVLVVTADTRRETRERVESYAPILMIPKPVDPVFLMDSLEAALPPGSLVRSPLPGEIGRAAPREPSLSRAALVEELGARRAEAAISELSGAALAARRAISAALIVDEWAAFASAVEAVFAVYASRLLGLWASRARSALAAFDADELGRLRGEFDALLGDGNGA